MRYRNLITSVLTLFFLLSLTLSVQGDAKLLKKVKKEGPYDFTYQKYKLDNGLTLIIHEDHSDPIAHVRLGYHVGSAREKIGHFGFAHLFEHMMFEGSKHIEAGQHDKIIKKAGGNMNAFTQKDKTVYYENVPKNYLETALWLEADRMGYLFPAITKENFENQRDVVISEKNQNQLDRPYGLSGQVLARTLYPFKHPYSWETIGYVSDLKTVKLDAVQKFYLRWYNPNNAVLVVAGDVKPKNVVNMTEKYFGPIPKGPEAPPMSAPKVRLPVDRYGNYMDDNVYLPLTIMAFPTVPAYHPDEPALDILGQILGSDKNSYLYQKFVKPNEANQASTFHNARELAGELRIYYIPNPEDATFFRDMEGQFNTIEQNLRDAIKSFGKEGITKELVQQAKKSTITNLIERTSSIKGFRGRASFLMNWEMLLNQNFNLSDEIQRYKRVTKQDVINVYNRYIKNKNAAIVNVYPKRPGSDESDTTKSVNPYKGKKPEKPLPELAYESPEHSFDMNARPEPGSPVKPKVPDYYQKQTDKGMEVIGTKFSEVPIVNLQITLEGGNLMLANEEGGLMSDPAKKMGVANLTADMMDEGTENYSAKELATAMNKLGSDISFSGGKRSTTIRISSLVENLDSTLALLEEMLLRPAFNEEDFERVQDQHIKSIRNRKKSKNYKGSVAFQRLLYPNSILGAYRTEKTIKKLDLSDVKDYYNKYYTPSLGRLVVVGDISKQKVMSKLDFMKNWEKKEVSAPKINTQSSIEETQIKIVHKPYTKQSLIIMGHHGPSYDATGDYYKAQIMNFQLGGGGLSSRLNKNLREDKGYTYGIYSYFSGDKHNGRFIISGDFKQAATDSAIQQTLMEIEKYRNKGIKPKELERVKNFYLNSQVLEYEAPYQKASFLSRIAKYDLEKGFIDKQEKILNNMTREEVNQLAKDYIHPDKMLIVVVGNKYQIKDKLKDLEIGDVDTYKLD